MLLVTTRDLAETSAYSTIAPEVVAAIDLLHLTGGRLTQPDLARASGMPERTLRRRVGEAVGLSIKSLAAVLLVQRTMRLLAQPTCKSFSLVQAALEGGYSDQAHLTREFRRYGGFTPGRRPPVAFGSLLLSDMAKIFKRPHSKAI